MRHVCVMYVLYAILVFYRRDWFNRNCLNILLLCCTVCCSIDRFDGDAGGRWVTGVQRHFWFTPFLTQQTRWNSLTIDIYIDMYIPTYICIVQAPNSPPMRGRQSAGAARIPPCSMFFRANGQWTALCCVAGIAFFSLCCPFFFFQLFASKRMFIKEKVDPKDRTQNRKKRKTKIIWKSKNKSIFDIRTLLRFNIFFLYFLIRFFGRNRKETKENRRKWTEESSTGFLSVWCWLQKYMCRVFQFFESSPATNH